MPLLNSKIIEFYNIVYTPVCNSNLISLSQLQKSRILFHNDPIIMILMRERKIIVYIK